MVQVADKPRVRVKARMTFTPPHSLHGPRWAHQRGFRFVCVYLPPEHKPPKHRVGWAHVYGNDQGC